MLRTSHLLSRSISLISKPIDNSSLVTAPYRAAEALASSSSSPLRRLFSSNDENTSHSDFDAVKKDMNNLGEISKVHELIKSHVSSNRIMLYMKGSPSAPQCGFSARVISVLKSHDVPFSSVNVLEYDEIREGIKTFSDWPTIPQLYVDGEFVGGCDIIEQMEQEGELKEVLQGEQ